jgi:AcrR family transcriptional regulator
VRKTKATQIGLRGLTYIAKVAGLEQPGKLRKCAVRVWPRSTEGLACGLQTPPSLASYPRSAPKNPARDLGHQGQFFFEHVHKLVNLRGTIRIFIIEHVQIMAKTKATPKAEETRQAIYEAALAQFREEGFESATMRDIARKAGVATGAAYYYYPSKESIVMEFYRRSCAAMQPHIAEALRGRRGLESRLRELIRVKLEHFSPNRAVLRALLRNGADPKHPLSPFSEDTREIREIDIAWFAKILEDCGIRIPEDLRPDLPGVLWFYQMGVILFWVTDDSPKQARTERLLELSSKVVWNLIRVSALPLMKPVRRTALELIRIVKGE